MRQEGTIVLNYDRELQCISCESMTTVGQLSTSREGEYWDIQLMPQCPLHGFANECDQAAQFASVERYVSYLFDNEGAAKVLSVVSPETVPGYVPFEDARSVDLGWQVEWTCADKRKEVYIVWCVDLLCFEVYQ